jgi:hypothetical protein
MNFFVSIKAENQPVDKAKRLAQKPCPERSRMGGFEQSLCFEHKGLRSSEDLLKQTVSIRV